MLDKIRLDTKEQKCFFSLQDDAFLQVKLKKKPCTSKPFPQDMRNSIMLKEAINELKENNPKIILFDIDNYSEFYSLGLRLEDAIRSTIYNKELIEYIIENYNPYVNINGYYIWKKTNIKKKNILINTIINNEKLLIMSPNELCKSIDIKDQLCFISVSNNSGDLIDIVNGEIGNLSILNIIKLDQKHYFNKKIKKTRKLSLIPDNLNNLKFKIHLENKNIIIIN